MPNEPVRPHAAAAPAPRRRGPSPLVAALLSDSPRAPKAEASDEAPERDLKEVTIYTAAATALDSGPFHIETPAAAVAIIDHPLKQRTVVELFDEAGIREAAIAAAAVGLEALRQGCHVRLFTPSAQLVWVMTGYIRSAAYVDQTRRIHRAVRRHGHDVVWVTPETEYERTLSAIAYDAAHRLANLQTPGEELLRQLSDETTRQVADTKRTGRAPRGLHAQPERPAPQLEEQGPEPRGRGSLRSLALNIISGLAPRAWRRTPPPG